MQQECERRQQPRSRVRPPPRSDCSREAEEAALARRRAGAGDRRAARHGAALPNGRAQRTAARARDRAGRGGQSSREERQRGRLMELLIGGGRGGVGGKGKEGPAEISSGIKTRSVGLPSRCGPVGKRCGDREKAARKTHGAENGDWKKKKVNGVCDKKSWVILFSHALAPPPAAQPSAGCLALITILARSQKLISIWARQLNCCAGRKTAAMISV